MTAVSRLSRTARRFWICFNSQCLARADKFHSLLPLPRIVCMLHHRFWNARNQTRPGSLFSCSRGREDERPWERGCVYAPLTVSHESEASSMYIVNRFLISIIKKHTFIVVLSCLLLLLGSEQGTTGFRLSLASLRCILSSRSL